MWFKKIKKYLVNILSNCCLCKNNNGIVCEECKKEFKPNYNQEFNRYKLLVPYKYNYPLNDLILRFKYGNKHFLSDYFAELICKKFLIPDDSILVPIPISKSKLLTRGYNQTFLLAKSIKNYLLDHYDYENIRIDPMILKSENTSYNVDSSAHMRKQKAELIHLDNPIGIINKRVILIDDVIASGSPIARAIELIEPYTSEIFIVAIAKT